jgi:predicted HAD superfamily hydrolase
MITILKKYIIKHFDTISFDIFDTLIERDVNIPSDIFYKVGLKILGKNEAETFRKDRIEAEEKARKSKLGGEVTLEEIYLLLPSKYYNKLDVLLRTEIETEISLCHAKENIVSLLKELNGSKKIFLISDMYLPKEVIKKMLDKCNIHGYNNIYVSNEYGINKISGRLFIKVFSVEKINPKRHLHIGDSIKADFLGAYRAGAHSYHIKRKSRLIRIFNK